MTDPSTVLDELKSLPTPIRRKAPTNNTEVARKQRHDLAEKGGKITNIRLTPRAHAVIKWSKTTPGMPSTQGRIIDEALQLYQQKHRGGETVRRILDDESLAKLDTMLAARPAITEGELLGLAIRHLSWSFEHSPDGCVDT